MLIKYVGEAPIRHGARLVKSGEEIETTETEGNALIASRLFEETKKKTAKVKKASKAEEPQAEKSKGAE